MNRSITLLLGWMVGCTDGAPGESGTPPIETPPAPAPGNPPPSPAPEVCSEGLPVLVSGEDGVYFEIEALDATAGWTLDTADAGFFGTGYFVWGDERGRSPRDDDPFLEYCFRVENAGTYALEIHGTRIQDPGTFCEDAANDECNDIWVQIDGKGSGDQDWTKKMIKPNWGQWRWDPNWDPQNGSPFPTEVELSAGLHVLGIAGRSHRTRIDAVRFFREGTDAPAPPAP